MRSASFRCAIEMTLTRGLPAGVHSRRATSSGSPCVQAANPGEASRLLSAIASAKRSFGGKNASRSSTPSRSNGGFWIARMSAGDVEVAPVASTRSRGGCDEDVLAALHRVGVDPEEREQARASSS